MDASPPVLITVKQRRSPFPETDRQTGRALSDSLSLTLSLSFSLNLCKSLKGRRPLFFLQLLPYASAAPIVKAKILIFPHTLFFCTAEGKDLTLSSLPGLWPLPVLSVEKMSLLVSLTLHPKSSGAFWFSHDSMPPCLMMRLCLGYKTEIRTFPDILIMRSRSQVPRVKNGDMKGWQKDEDGQS